MAIMENGNNLVYHRYHLGARGRVCKLSTTKHHPLLQASFLNSFSSSMNETSISGSISKENSGDQQIINRQSKVKSKSQQQKPKPLVVTTAFDGLDPLSAALQQSSLDDDERTKLVADTKIDVIESRISVIDRHLRKSSKLDYFGEDFVHWAEYKGCKILTKFHTSEKLSIKSSYLNHVDRSGSIRSTVSSSSGGLPQRLKDRLDSLDDLEESSVQEMFNLSQSEYVKRIEELNTALQEAWDADQRVKALKIAIQSAKQLSSVNVIQFYPSKFALISDVLDNFGSLVYHRLESKANDPREEFAMVQETCRNWFYKISSIRELLPRFYIECAILPIYQFLIPEAEHQTEYEHIFVRLVKMIRGVGDPLVAVYCRVYLTRVVMQLQPQTKSIYLAIIKDTFNSVIQFTWPVVTQTLQQQKIDYLVYCTLHTPALDWIFTAAFYRADEQLYAQVYNSFKSLLVGPTSTVSIQAGVVSLVLHSLISSFPPRFVVEHISEFLSMITNQCGHPDKSNLFVYPKSLLMKSIGVALNSLENPSIWFQPAQCDTQLRQLLNELWRITGSLTDKAEYIACIETWAEFIARNCELTEINHLLGDVTERMSTLGVSEQYPTQLYLILTKVITHGCDRSHYGNFFSMSNLMPYLDLFYKEEMKVDACKMLVDSFIKSFTKSEDTLNLDDVDTFTSDPVILNSITYLCKVMHDSITALTLDDEKRQITTLIIGFLRRISFGRDFEAQLNFYVEARAAFSNLDHVLFYLVSQVNTLAMETHRIVHSHHTKKTTAFVTACLAYTYITIPSIENITIRLSLYLASAQCALVNTCLPQTDALFKSAITLLRQLPSHYETPNGKLASNDHFLSSYVSQLLSTLISVPDNPDLGFLYLFKGLYNVLKEYTFEPISEAKYQIWSNMIRYLTTATWEEYPYHISKMDSNDTLYGQSTDFLKEIEIYVDIVFQELLDNFKRSTTVAAMDDTIVKRQTTQAIEIINLILVIGKADSLAHVINQLWNWIVKHQTKHKILQEAVMNRKIKSTLASIKKALQKSSNGGNVNVEGTMETVNIATA